MPGFFSRRSVGNVIVWGIPVIMGLIPTIAASPQEVEKGIAYRWRVPVTYSDTVKESLKFKGKIETEQDSKGLPLIFIFAGVSLLPSLADAILTLRKKLVQPGIKIDARGNRG